MNIILDAQKRLTIKVNPVFEKLFVLCGGHSRHDFEQITSITKTVPRRTLVQLMNSYIMAFDTMGELLNKLTPNQKKYYALSDYNK